FWAVAGLNAAAWPLAFLVIEIGRAPRGGRAVLATALGITLSSLGLLLVGWGLVMVLAPEYTVGWYLPARGGNGTENRRRTTRRRAGSRCAGCGTARRGARDASPRSPPRSGPTPGSRCWRAEASSGSSRSASGSSR